MFFAATAMGKDLAPRVAARLGAGLASDCTKIAVRDGTLEFTRPIFAGKAFLSFDSELDAADRDPPAQRLPARGRDRAAAAEVVRKAVAIPDGSVKGRVAEVLKEESAEIDVTEADVVVSGGRGMKGPENFALLRELAAAHPPARRWARRARPWIRAGSATSTRSARPARPFRPTSTWPFGISGAIQHLAGMSSSKYIVAVNKDPEAPIFKVADYGIVGDLFEVIPHLKEELKKIASE